MPETVNFDITSKYDPEVIKSVNKFMSTSKGGDYNRTLNKLGYVHLYDYLNERYKDASAADIINWKVRKLKKSIFFDCTSFMKRGNKDAFYLLQLLSLLYYTESNQRNQSIIDAIANVMYFNQVMENQSISDQMYYFTENQKLACDDIKGELLCHKQSKCSDIENVIKEIDKEWSQLTVRFHILVFQRNISLDEIKQNLSSIIYNLYYNNISYTENENLNAIETFFLLLSKAEKVSDIHKDMELLKISKNVAHTIPLPNTTMKQYLWNTFYNQIITWTQFQKLIDLSNPMIDNEHLFTIYGFMLNHENFTLGTLHKLNHETKNAIRFALEHAELITTKWLSLRLNKTNILVTEWALTIRTLISLFMNKEKKIIKIIRNFKTSDEAQCEIIFLLLDYYYISLYNTESTKDVWDMTYMIRTIEQRIFYCNNTDDMQKFSDINSLLVTEAFITNQERNEVYYELCFDLPKFQYVYDKCMNNLLGLLWIDFYWHLIYNNYHQAVQTIYNQNRSLYAVLSDWSCRYYDTDVDLTAIHDLYQHIQKVIQVPGIIQKLEEIKKLKIEATKANALQKFKKVIAEQMKKLPPALENNPIQLELDIWYENREYHCSIDVNIDSFSQKIQIINIIILNSKPLPDKTD